MILETKIDWKAFAYKYSENPQSAFENLTYYLFCHEFNQKNGIFRYFNQPHIETNPIQAGKELIGFQSKYYQDSVSISSKKGELIEAIAGAAETYPGITTIYFYISRDFASSSKKNKTKPAYQTDIEKAAQKLGIKVVWKGKSHIEAQLMLNNQLAICRNVFFQVDSAVQDCCKQIDGCKDDLFKHIKTEIQYKDKDVILKLNDFQLDTFLNSESQVLVIDGDAGSGKSAFIKNLLMNTDNDVVVIAFKSTDMDVENKIKFMSGYGALTLEEVLDVYEESKNRVLYIDAVEKYYVMEHQETFEDVLNVFIERRWKIVFTVRTAYKESLVSILLTNVKVKQYHIDLIAYTNLVNIADEYGFKLPNDKRLQEILRVPFYLGLYLALENIDDEKLIALNREQFEEKIWNEIIRNNKKRKDNMPTRRETILIKMTMDMLQSGSYFYLITAEDDHAALMELENDGVIVETEDSKKYSHAHDVFEELVVSHIFTDQYKANIVGSNFFEKIHASLRIRKLFRGWLTDFASIAEHHDFVFQILRDKNVDTIWKDEVLLTIVSAGSLKEIYYKLTLNLKNDGYEMLKKIIFLINTCCRVAEHSEIYLNKGNVLPFRLSKPSGYAWEAVFSFILENKDSINWDKEIISDVIDILDSWTKHPENAKKTNTKFAGEIGLWIFEKMAHDREWRYGIREGQIEKLYVVLLNSAWMIDKELEKVFQRVMDDRASENNGKDHWHHHRDVNTPKLYMDMAKRAILDISHCGRVPQAMPEMVLKLIWNLWIKQVADIEFYNTDIEDDFGLDSYLSGNYYPVSAFKTPIMLILKARQELATDFLIDLFNRAGEAYVKSNLNLNYKETFRIIVHIKDQKVEQIASDRLWKMYRGTSVGPHHLVSLLMGFEKWLYMFAEKSDSKTITDYCQYVLTNSQNVMLTAVIVSIAQAYPKKMIDIICDLLKTKEIFHLDENRFNSEAGIIYFPPNNSNNYLFMAERKESDKLPHRKERLEKIVLKFQTNNIWESEKEYILQREKVFAAIDQAVEDIDEWHVYYKFPYYRMDIRRYQEIVAVNRDENGNSIVTTKPKITEDMEKVSSQRHEMHDNQFKYTDLWLWGHNAFSRENNDKLNEKYSDISDVCREVKELWDILNGSQDEKTKQMPESLLNDFQIPAVAYASAVLLRDYDEVLEDQYRNLCKLIILKMAYYFTETSEFQIMQAGNGVDAIVLGLCLMMDDDNRKIANNESPMYLLLKLVLKDWNHDSRVIKQIANNLWKCNENAGKQIIYLFSLIADKYREEIIRNQDLSLDKFFQIQKDIISQGFNKAKITLEDIDLANVSEVTIFTIISLVSTETEEAFVIAELTKNTAMHITFGNENLLEKHRSVIGNTIDYVLWFSDLLLYCNDAQRKILIESFLQRADFLNNENNVQHFLEWIIQKEDQCGKVDEFWNVWELLEAHMIEVSNEREKTYYSNYNGPIGRDAIISGYLFANTPWKEKIHSCALLSKERALFFDEFIDKSGSFRAVLYAISRLLYTVGRDAYYERGVEWLYKLVQKDPECQKSLYDNTLLYMEEYIGGFAVHHKTEFRVNPELARKILFVLEYMVNQGSEVAFFIREQV